MNKINTLSKQLYDVLKHPVLSLIGGSMKYFVSDDEHDC